MSQVEISNEAREAAKTLSGKILIGTNAGIKQHIEEQIQLAINSATEQLRKENEGLDSIRLNWLDKQRIEHFPHWDSDGNWANPSVSWRVSQSTKHGEYSMPKELKELAIRQAIDAAIQQNKV